MHHKNVVRLLFSTCLLLPSLANAALVTIEPDDYVLGTNISNISSQVTLHNVDYFGNHNAIRSRETRHEAASTGHLTFGNFGIGCLRNDCSVDDYEGFGLFFNEEVDRVSLLGLNWGYTPGLHASWAAFDQGGNRIGYGSSAIAAVGESVLIDIQLAGIWSLFIGGGANTNAFEFDYLTFDTKGADVAVLEPSPLLLLAAGLGLLSFIRRRT